MNKLTFRELSKLLGVGPATINVNVNRGKLIHTEEIDDNGKIRKYIDILNPLNKLWLDEQKEKGKDIDYNRLYDKPTKKSPIIKEPKEVKKEVKKETKDPKIVTSDVDLKKYEQAKLKYDLELEKLEAEIKLKNIEIEKKEGRLVPVDAVESIFIFALTEMHKLYTREVENLASIYNKKDKINEIRKALLESLSEIGNEAKEILKAGLIGIVEEYQEVRGRGEKQ